MDRRSQLYNIRIEIFENVLKMLEGTSPENAAPCYAILETPGMDDEFWTRMEKIYRDDEDILCVDSFEKVFDFNELDIYQMAQVEEQLSEYYKK